MKQIIFLTLFLTNTVFAQFIQNTKSDFIVDSIKLKNNILIPRISVKNINNKVISKRINNWILEEYGMSKWTDRSGGIWGQASISFIGFEINGNILTLKFHMTSKGSESDRKYFISLISGSHILKEKIPLSSLFKYDKYLPFIEKYWYNGMKEAEIESQECCDNESNIENSNIINYYSVWGYSITKNNLILKDYSWGPGGACWSACSINYTKKIPIAEIKSFLNSFGEKIIQDGGYNIDNYNFGSSNDMETNSEQVIYSNIIAKYKPNNIFIIGSIDAKYSFKMSLKIIDNGYEKTVKGVYHYNSKPLNKITLIGYKKENKIELNEYYKGKINGHFSIEINNNNNRGKWTNEDASKIYNIDFIETIE
jgi:hypothetical protein